ncbi:general substrate transporter [Gymnopus androsaceus JB14]|uniref:General substrate transporter n=1 Tax=Gymnopus androsaceus JB14 TaxID=1447944 RepID=A0A6A4HQ52_9AGAR|nr:general substrate transporter [Gymnopus androsaceus JB14]
MGGGAAAGDLSWNVFAKEYRRPLLFCSIAVVGAILYGYDGTYYTSILDMTKFNNDYGVPTTNADGTVTYAITSQDKSLTTSIVQAGEVVGSLIAGPIGDWGGRRMGMFVACFLVTIGVIIQISVAGSIAALTTGRAVLGMGIGCISNAVPMYLSEIPPVAIRGSIVGSWQLMLAIGQVIGACVGQGVKDRMDTGAYRIPMGINLGIVLLLSTGAMWIPESPRWLFSKGREEETIKALERVNADQPNVAEAVQEQFILYVKARDEEQEIAGKEPSRWSDLFHGTTRRKFICAVGILIAQQIGGVQFIFSYTTTFLSGVGIENAFLITIIVDIVEVIGVIVSFFLVNRFGRRPLLLVTSTFMTIFLLIVGAMGSLHGHRTAAQNNLIAAGIILYVFFFNLAWGPLAWVIATELSVGKNRQKIMSVGTACFWISAFVVTFTMPYLYDASEANLEAQIGYIYAGGSIIGMVFVYYCIPETLGRSLEEINHMMDAKIPTHEWGTYDLNRDVEREAIKKNGAQVEHIDHPGAPEKVV